MRTFNKIISGFLSAAMFLSASSVMMTSSVSAATEVLLGDANGDGCITIADSTAIQQYLGGRYATSAYCFTAMDVNQDKIVDMTDSYIIMYKDAYHITTEERVTKDLYTVPDNSGRYYWKYNCGTKSSSRYYLGSTTSTLNSVEDDMISTMSTSPDNYDYVNTNVVQLVIGGYIGSGFVISDHIIATAAHCVYDDNGFATSVKVNIYNEKANVSSANLVASFNAESYHIPELYKNQTSSKRDSYDYALIYVGTDSQGKGLLDYVSAWDFAVPSLEFSKAQNKKELTSSGFTYYDNNIWFRYFSTGEVFDFSADPNESHNLPNLRIASLAASKGGKSGGAIYYTSSYGYSTYNSIVAVLTGGKDAGSNTWGTKINPTLLRFYKRNPYI